MEKVRSFSLWRQWPMPLGLILWACFGVAGLPAAMANEPGEFELRPVRVLSAEEISRLRAFCKEDPMGKALRAGLAEEVTDWIGRDPVPLQKIDYEGLVNTHPARLACVEKLAVMDDLAAAYQSWQCTGDPATAAALLRHLQAWTATYTPTGNEVNENKLMPLLVTAWTFRGSLSGEDRKRTDDWVRRIASFYAQKETWEGPPGNRLAKRFQLLAFFSIYFERKDWREAAIRGFQSLVTHGLRADGTSYDLERRDSLTYHTSALLSLLIILEHLGPQERGLYLWKSPQGSYLKKSVDYVLPYVEGKQERREWLHSKVELDHLRGKSGLEAYRPGRLYDPVDALPLLEKATAFDAKIFDVIRAYGQRSGKSIPPTLDGILNASLASRP